MFHDGEKKNIFSNAGKPFVRIYAEMNFLNPSNKTEEIEVLFPIMNQWEISEMAVKADGVDQTIDKFDETIDLSPEKKESEKHRRFDYVYLNWLRWKMKFKPGLTKLIVKYRITALTISYSRNWEKDKSSNEYKDVNSGFLDENYSGNSAFNSYPTHYGGLTLFSSMADKWETTETGREYIQKHNRLYGVSYVFHTGGQWKGVISSAKFRVTHATRGALGARGCTPYKTKAHNNKPGIPSWQDALRGLKPEIKSNLSGKFYTIEFTNVKPDFELLFLYHPSLEIDEEIETVKNIQKEKPGRFIQKMIEYLESIKSGIMIKNPF